MKPSIAIPMGIAGMIAAIGTSIAGVNGLFSRRPHWALWCWGVSAVLIVVAIFEWRRGVKSPTTEASKLNLKCDHFVRRQIIQDGERYRSMEMVGRVIGQAAILLHIQNRVDYPDFQPRQSEKVKAQLTFIDSGKKRYTASPAAWLDEPYSSVTFGPGDTRFLILVMNGEPWRALINRRDRESSPLAFEYGSGTELWVGNKGSIEVLLFEAQSGRKMCSFHSLGNGIIHTRFHQ